MRRRALLRLRQLWHTRPMHTPPAITHRGPRLARLVLPLILCSLLAPSLPAEQPSREAIAAFDQYIQSKELLAGEELSSHQKFLYIDRLPASSRIDAIARLRRGEILVEREVSSNARSSSTPGALIHDWTGIAFVPGVSLRETLAMLQNYDRDADYYRPQVLESCLLSRQGDDFRVFLRLKQSHGITLVFDTEYDVRYTQLDASRAYSRSYSRHIAEVETLRKLKTSENQANTTGRRKMTAAFCGVSIHSGAFTNRMAGSSFNVMRFLSRETSLLDWAGSSAHL
jgi:hypothetical protein